MYMFNGNPRWFWLWEIWYKHRENNVSYIGVDEKFLSSNILKYNSLYTWICAFSTQTVSSKFYETMDVNNMSVQLNSAVADLI